LFITLNAKIGKRLQLIGLNINIYRVFEKVVESGRKIPTVEK